MIFDLAVECVYKKIVSRNERYEHIFYVRIFSCIFLMKFLTRSATDVSALETEIFLSRKKPLGNLPDGRL